MNISNSRKIPWVVQWFTWPALFGGSITVALIGIARSWNFGAILGIASVVTVAIAITAESLYPLSSNWRMTRRSFHRDLKYLAVGISSIAATNALFGLASITLNTDHTGPLTKWPLYLAAPIGLLVVDFLNYWQHRWSHEAPCITGRFLWRSHATHHLSDKVYVLMHPAEHPINVLIVRGFTQVLPLYLLGVTPAAVLLISLVISVQTIISHCNADFRAGWFNYVFVGTELHRYHHSADMDEAKNYAVALSFIDILFGTFRYRPGIAPARLGVADSANYPESYQVWRVLLLPFHSQRQAG